MATATLTSQVKTAMSGLCPLPLDRILIIANDIALQKGLRRLFSTEGYEVDVVSDGVTGLEMLRRERPSALILDVQHPGSTGRDLCHEIVRSAPSLPFLIISTNSDVVDKVLLLEMGADDYMTIPFSPRELVARLRALMRRAARGRSEACYVFEDVRVDFSRMDVIRSGKKVYLTAKEFRTLEFMIKNAQRVISRDELLNEVWGYQSYPCTRTVDNHILRLRQKLENDPSDPSHFLTIHGVGYRFVP